MYLLDSNCPGGGTKKSRAGALLFWMRYGKRRSAGVIRNDV